MTDNPETMTSRPLARLAFSVLVLSTSALCGGPSLAHGDYRRDADDAFPLSPGFSFGDAPLGALGKIVGSSDPQAAAMCTGTLVDNRGLVLTDASCLKRLGSVRSIHFVPFHPNEGAPHREAITITGLDVRGDAAIPVLEDELQVAAELPFIVGSRGESLPKDWNETANWVVAGYIHDDPTGFPRIRVNCRFESTHRERAASGDLHSFPCASGFLPGSPIFAHYWQGWHAIGISTLPKADTEQSFHSAALILFEDIKLMVDRRLRDLLGNPAYGSVVGSNGLRGGRFRLPVLRFVASDIIDLPPNQ